MVGIYIGAPAADRDMQNGVVVPGLAHLYTQFGTPKVPARAALAQLVEHSIRKTGCDLI